METFGQPGVTVGRPCHNLFTLLILSPFTPPFSSLPVLVLLQFLYRLSLGLAFAMAITSPKQVTSGFFRNHLYVLLGLNVLAAAVAWTDEAGRFTAWIPTTAAIVSYVGAVLWLYELPHVGRPAIGVVGLLGLLGAWQETVLPSPPTFGDQLLFRLDPVAGGLTLGMTIGAMLLGHWYLNAPGMKLAPLRQLVLGMAAAIVLRAVVSGVGLGFTVASDSGALETGVFQAMLALRWLAGIVGSLVVAGMTWQTLKIPNTQSATGILYVGVITTFLGELTAQLLSQRTPFPL